MARLRTAAMLLAGFVSFIGVAWGQPPDSEPSGRIDRYGDPLPEGAIARLGSVRFKQRTKSWHSDVAFSPDSKTLAVTFSDTAGCGVLMLEAASGRVIRRLDVPGNAELYGLVFSPDGKLLLTGGDREIFILETDRDGRFGRFLKRAGAWHFAFLPDNKTLVATGGDWQGKDNNQIRLWDIQSGQEIGRFKSDESPPTEIHVSRDGKRLTCYSQSSGSLGVWELPKGKLVSQRQVKKEIQEVSKDLKIGILDKSPGNSYQVWDIEADKKLFHVDGIESWCTLAPNGRVLVVSPKEMRLLDVPSGRESRQFENSDGLCYCSTCFSPDDKLLAVWHHWGDGQKGHSTIRLWNVPTGKELVRTGGHRDGVRALAITADGGLIASAGSDRTVRLWEPQTSRELRVYAGHHDNVENVALSPDGRMIASAGRASGLHIWDAQTGKCMGKFDWSEDFGFSPDGKKLLICSESQTIRVFDVALGREMRPVELGERASLAQVSPDGKLLATVESEDESADTITLRNPSTGRPYYKFKGDKRERFHRLAFSPDSKFLAVGRHQYPDVQIGGTIHIPPTGHEIKVWEIATGKETGQIKLHDQPSTFLFSPNGAGLIGTFWTSQEEPSLHYWGLDSWPKRPVPSGHLDTVHCLALSADGRLLISGSADGTVLVRETADLALLNEETDGKLPAKETEELWNDLNGHDGMKMQYALGRLTLFSRTTVPFLRERMVPVAGTEPPELARLIDALNSERFMEREQASADLEKLAELAEPALHKALINPPSQEAKRRMERLLAQLEGPVLRGSQLQAVRVTALLERIGTSNAHELLRKLAGGAAEARLTREAKASLERLEKRMGAVRNP